VHLEKIEINPQYSKTKQKLEAVSYFFLSEKIACQKYALFQSLLKIHFNMTNLQNLNETKNITYGTTLYNLS